MAVSDRAIEGYRAWMTAHYDKYKTCAERFETGGLDALVACLREMKRAKTAEEVVSKYTRKIKGGR